jgi:hypothetical protein
MKCNVAAPVGSEGERAKKTSIYIQDKNENEGRVTYEISNERNNLKPPQSWLLPLRKLNKGMKESLLATRRGCWCSSCHRP